MARDSFWHPMLLADCAIRCQVRFWRWRKGTGYYRTKIVVVRLIDRPPPWPPVLSMDQHVVEVGPMFLHRTRSAKSSAPSAAPKGGRK